ncbi:MAG: beta-galactosidase [Oscillospiraceae bacterium]
MEKLGRMVGTNYHPHDWDSAQWPKDLDRMKEAGFTVVRLGHLCWDSFEPEENQYCFDWMDAVMELCRERGLRVFLDIPTRPAPVWLHQRYPSVDIVDASGQRLNANTRYMEDVGDPHFQRHALKFVRLMAERYANHPALMAFGLCNELGSGFHSYSPTALVRFQQWLAEKYQTVDALNRAWNSQRWSRRISRFSDVFFPVSGAVSGPPERFLDMKRFFSDEILAYFKKMHDTVAAAAPGVPISTNHWAENPRVGFDYQKGYRECVDYAGLGFYPGINPEYEDGFIGSCMNIDYRIGELDTPLWGLEFQTGTNGGYGCPRGVMRMYAYLAWAYRCDMACAWTWRTMLGGEEQYFYGLLDHDGTCSRKYDEFKQIAREWNALEQQGVCRKQDGRRIAVAYSYDSYKTSQYASNFYKTDYVKHILAVYRTLFHKNLDCNIIDLRQVEKEYDLVFVPGHCIMDEASAQTIRRMVQSGATVIMTGYSAKADEHSTVFSEPMPGRLSNVFGIRVHGFDRTRTHVSTINEGGVEKNPEIIEREHLDIELDGRLLGVPIDYHEYIEPVTAEVVGRYSSLKDESTAAVTCNFYGKGKAVYVGIPAEEEVISALLERYAPKDCKAPEAPNGVVARSLAEGRRIYINTTGEAVSISLGEDGRGLLRHCKYESMLPLAPYDVEIIEPV